MSKYTQIDIRLLPVYGEGGIRKSIPNLFNLLSECGYDLVLEKEPSLFEMVEVMIRIKNDPHIRAELKKPIIRKLDELIRTRDNAREALLARRLNELDRFLYKLEDLFEDL
jgi:hypothetical protein